MTKGVVKSVWRTVKIFELLSCGDSLSVTEISKKLGFPKASVYEILFTLNKEGIIEKDPATNRYHLGLKLFELGNMARHNLDIRKAAIPFLKRLNEHLDETVHLTLLDHDEVLYIECFESTKRLRTYSVIGDRAPLHCTAVGKAILAFLSQDEIERIIQVKGLENFTENTLTHKDLLLKDLEKVVQYGYAVDNMEHEEGVRCVGAPIRNNEGNVLASISVSGPSQRITTNKIPEIATIVISTAREISSRLGYKSS
jgi:IclR family KDG regulon transcriptional repressor